MTININNHDYNFDLQGTVGLVYLCQRILDHEPDFANSTFDQIALMYCAFQTSNPKEKDLPDLMAFTASLTSKTMSDLTTFFWKRWGELEGTATVTEDSSSVDKKETAKGED